MDINNFKICLFFDNDTNLLLDIKVCDIVNMEKHPKFTNYNVKIYEDKNIDLMKEVIEAQAKEIETQENELGDLEMENTHLGEVVRGEHE